MWHEVNEYNYAAIPEGKVKLMVVPHTNPMAQLLTIEGECQHYEYYGQQQARFRMNLDSTGGVSYLDLTDYAVVYWNSSN
jgi:hypothetical protein